MKNVLIIFSILLFFTSCASSIKKDSSLELEELISQGKYVEARALAKTSHLQQVSQKISNAEKCQPTLKKCELYPNSINLIRECLYEINLNCQGNDNLIYNYTPNVASRLKEIRKSLNEKADIIKKNQESDIDKLCAPSIRWGYFREKDCGTCAWAIKKDFSKMHGEYLERSKCEEARLLEDKSINTGTGCYKKYIGDKKFIEHYSLMAMYDFKKIELEFSTSLECAEAKSNGYKFYNEDLELFVLSKHGSNEENKIIGTCKLEKTPICMDIN